VQKLVLSLKQIPEIVLSNDAKIIQPIICMGTPNWSMVIPTRWRNVETSHPNAERGGVKPYFCFK